MDARTIIADQCGLAAGPSARSAHPLTTGAVRLNVGRSVQGRDAGALGDIRAHIGVARWRQGGLIDASAGLSSLCAIGDHAGRRTIHARTGALPAHHALLAAMPVVAASSRTGPSIPHRIAA